MVFPTRLHFSQDKISIVGEPRLEDILSNPPSLTEVSNINKEQYTIAEVILSLQVTGSRNLYNGCEQLPPPKPFFVHPSRNP